MLRPCFLVVDRNHSGSISTRKLVIETAKLNVITAYSGAEAVETLQQFPRVDAVVLDPHIRDMSCDELVTRLKQLQPQLPIISVGRTACEGADHSLDSFDPKRLLAFLQSLVPAQAKEIARQEEESKE